LAESEPAYAIGSAHQRGGEAGGVFNNGLGVGEIAFDQLRRFQGEIDVGLRMVADFMALRQDFARYFRMPFDVPADLEKGGGNVVLIEEVQNVGGGGRGAIVERERDGFAAGLAPPEGVVEYERGTSAHRPGRRGKSRGQSRRRCDLFAQTISSLTGSQRTVRCCR